MPGKARKSQKWEHKEPGGIRRAMVGGQEAEADRSGEDRRGHEGPEGARRNQKEP